MPCHSSRRVYGRADREMRLVDHDARRLLQPVVARRVHHAAVQLVDRCDDDLRAVVGGFGVVRPPQPAQRQPVARDRGRATAHSTPARPAHRARRAVRPRGPASRACRAFIGLDQPLDRDARLARRRSGSEIMPRGPTCCRVDRDEFVDASTTADLVRVEVVESGRTVDLEHAIAAAHPGTRRAARPNPRPRTKSTASRRARPGARRLQAGVLEVVAEDLERLDAVDGEREARELVVVERRSEVLGDGEQRGRAAPPEGGPRGRRWRAWMARPSPCGPRAVACRISASSLFSMILLMRAASSSKPEPMSRARAAAAMVERLVGVDDVRRRRAAASSRTRGRRRRRSRSGARSTR